MNEPTQRAATTVDLAHLRNAEEFTALIELLETVGGGGRLVYVRNPGNWGDALVHTGALQLLHRLSREVVSMGERQAAASSSAGDVLVVAAAGSWNPADRWGVDRVEQLGPRFSHTVVLPTTYELGPAELDPATVTYLRRDHLVSARSVPGSTFAPDLAFHVRRTIDVPGPAAAVRSYGKPVPGATASWHCPGNFDVSALGTSASPLNPFLQIVAGSTHVRTDRLHVAIAAALLGRHTELYGRAGDKSHAVFEASLRAYPNISFVPTNGSAPAPGDRP